MRSWLGLVILAGVLLFPNSARAQAPVRLGSLEVQLWPEYDQPNMLVIYDFKLPATTTVPVNVALRFPKEANLVAVASQAADGSLLYTDYLGPAVGDTWQTVTIQIQNVATYRIEYYQPLDRSGATRQFSYVWPGDYGVDSFGVTVRAPVDTTTITTDPILPSAVAADGATNLNKKFGELGLGQEFRLQLNYTKTSDALSASQQDLQPSQPLGAGTPGRVMLSNYLPYILGALGVVLIAGGGLYFWQSSRGASMRPKRHRAPAPRGGSASTDVYCHQCGTRAQPEDRFCRVCGTRLRQPGQ